jgi:hypothetical protein
LQPFASCSTDSNPHELLKHPLSRANEEQKALSPKEIGMLREAVQKIVTIATPKHKYEDSAGYELAM